MSIKPMTHDKRCKQLEAVRRELADAETALRESEYGFGPLADDTSRELMAKRDILRFRYGQLANGEN